MSKLFEVLLFGMVLGLTVSFFDPRKKGWVMGPVILGGFGALTGLVFSEMVLNLYNFDFNLLSTFSAIFSSVMLLFIARLIKVRGAKVKKHS